MQAVGHAAQEQNAEAGGVKAKPREDCVAAIGPNEVWATDFVHKPQSRHLALQLGVCDHVFIERGGEIRGTECSMTLASLAAVVYRLVKRLFRRR